MNLISCSKIVATLLEPWLVVVPERLCFAQASWCSLKQHQRQRAPTSRRWSERVAEPVNSVLNKGTDLLLQRSVMLRWLSFVANETVAVR